MSGYKIQHLVNWFHGNYCTRKCSDEIEKQHEHWEKLQELARRLDGVEMTHAAFLSMMRSDKTICDLSDDEWKQRKWSWKSTDCIVCKRIGMR
ncbi:hypothetical protein HZB02_03190 [Candidatus Woesearchaeota archaeon]|nr:hypothetical protein [Candidatus Woesearchaeota archaeon]